MGTFQKPGFGYMLDNDGWMVSRVSWLQKAPLAEKKRKMLARPARPAKEDQQDSNKTSNKTSNNNNSNNNNKTSNNNTTTATTTTPHTHSGQRVHS
jgi:hypothetical protein